MYRIGIDVGSTYTKYCILKDGKIDSLFMEKTPIRQKEYFEQKIKELKEEYQEPHIVSCGYGKKNVSGVRNINELTALARGCFHETNEDGVILDVGGQDTKIITQESGKLKEFFMNDKCAAGSGMFLSNALDMIGLGFNEINFVNLQEVPVKLSSTCAVFAQSEIVEMIADNRTEQEILQSVVWQIFIKAKPLLAKISGERLLLSGGLSQIPGITEFASKAMDWKCDVIDNGTYLAAIGCAVHES